MLKKLRSSAKNWISNYKNNSQSVSRDAKKLIMCKKCFTFYYKNSWHFERPEYLNLDLEEVIPVHFTECLACMEQEQASYEMESGLVLQ